MTYGRPAPEIVRDPLDRQIAVRVYGYRWVEWKHALLRGGPLDAPGRFLADPADPLAHLHSPAPLAAPLADQPFRRVPHYSTDVRQAIRAAARAGLFASAGVRMGQAEDGGWWVETDRPAVRVEAAGLATALCRATLEILDHGGVLARAP